MSSPPRTTPPLAASRPGNRPRRVAPWACLAAVLMAPSGCGRDDPPAAVEGTLRMNGRPLDNCLITFLPEPGGEATGPHSSALTDARGHYRLRLDDQRPGAAVGRHRVTVQDLSVSTGVRRQDHGAVDKDVEETPPLPPRPSRVPASYASPADTPLRRETKPGPQVIDLDVR